MTSCFSSPLGKQSSPASLLLARKWPGALGRLWHRALTVSGGEGAAAGRGEEGNGKATGGEMAAQGLGTR